MKILYGVQGTGNGHIAQISSIYPYLEKYAEEIDILISGNKYQLDIDFPIKFKTSGFSFITSNCKIDYFRTFLNMRHLLKRQENIPFSDYDLIVTDFEPIVSWGAKKYRIPCLYISHQASFLDSRTPRPRRRNFCAEMLFHHFIHFDDYIGFHFKEYSENICTPPLKKKISPSEEKKYFTVYLPWFELGFIVQFFSQIPQFHFHIFHGEVKHQEEKGNLTLSPLKKLDFKKNISSSSGLIANAGFLTSFETLLLKKKLLVIPLQGQYEQFCNAEALKDFGVPVYPHLNSSALKGIQYWASSNAAEFDFAESRFPSLLDQKIRNLVPDFFERD